VADSLFEFLSAQGQPPDLTIVTGDLTQRAKPWQFAAAKEFLSRLPCPVLCIPGNHDVPLYNPFLRFLAPFHRYDHYIGSHFPSEFEDDSILALGIRTVNIYSVAEGKLRHSHADLLRGRFPDQAHKLCVVAAHHPMFDAQGELRDAILELRPDLILSGHSHLSGTMKVSIAGHHALVVSAGTTISSRTRAEVNSFNWIEFSPETGAGSVEIFVHGKSGFAGKGRQDFRKGAG